MNLRDLHSFILALYPFKKVLSLDLSETPLRSSPQGGPPDMEEMWRDFNRKLSGFFRGGNAVPPNLNASGSRPPEMHNAGGIGLGLLAGAVGLVWAGSGFFIVQEGEQAVVTAFGEYSHIVDAGFSWRFPAPFQAHETVSLTRLRTIEVGRNAVSQATGLRESSMLTQDENIVDIRFSVQYRLKDARAYLYENRNPDEAVNQAAESAVREVVGRSSMDSVLYEKRDAIASYLLKSLQIQLDRLNTGIAVVNVNVGSVQAPEQVQAAFDDAFRATADRERLKNEGQAYANDVIPKAQGGAARLREQAEGYKARVVAAAEGDAQRFTQILAEYQKAPGVTRDRMYIDAMKQVYQNVTKVMVDSKAGANNMLYLPLDKLIQQSGMPSNSVPSLVPEVPVLPPAGAASPSAESRSREGQRTRDRDIR
jgi:modulator of FtsH protease HflK